MKNYKLKYIEIDTIENFSTNQDTSMHNNIFTVLLSESNLKYYLPNNNVIFYMDYNYTLDYHYD